MCTYMPVTELDPRESIQWGEQSIKAHTATGEIGWTKTICPGSKVQIVMREVNGDESTYSRVWEGLLEEISDQKLQKTQVKTRKEKHSIVSRKYMSPFGNCKALWILGGLE